MTMNQKTWIKLKQPKTPQVFLYLIGGNQKL